MDKVKLTSLYGDLHSFFTPSGFEVAIREQTGNDDGILSNVALNKDAASVNAFIQNIIVGLSHIEGLPTTEDILDMRLGDKYCILIQSRIFSLGNILKFTYEWVPGATPTAYEEDLNFFVWDYRMPLPKPGDPDYFSDRIKNYPVSVDQVYLYLTTSKGKKLRYKYLDGTGEQYLLKLPDSHTNINSKLIARGLEYQMDTTWITVSDFKLFSSREMGEIRDHLDSNDPQFDGTIVITDPQTNRTQYVSLIGLHDFFFQRGI